MFEIADNLDIPLTPLTCAIIAQTYSPSVAYMIILRRARNLCWADWHSQGPTMQQRIGHRLGYRLCQEAITTAIYKAVKDITKG